MPHINSDKMINLLVSSYEYQKFYNQSSFNYIILHTVDTLLCTYINIAGGCVMVVLTQHTTSKPTLTKYNHKHTHNIYIERKILCINQYI